MTFELKMTEQQAVDGLRSTFGNEFVTADVRGFCAANNIGYSTVTKKIQKYKVGKGKWNLEITQESVNQIENSFKAPAVEPVVERNLVPEVDDTFVKFGSFTDVKRIIQSKQFYPSFITGLSGNGKTFSVEQACAQLKRELIRVNITIETDEDDLIGGSVLLMVKPSGIMAQSWKLSNEEQSCSLTKSTLPLTRFSAFKASLREMEFSLRKLEESLNQLEDSTSSPPQILRVRVQTMEDSLELMCLTKPSLKDSQLPSSKSTPPPQ